MTSKFNQFLIQAEHNLQLIKNCVYGNSETEDPGIRDFHAEMIDVYNRYINDVNEKQTKVYGDSKIAEFIRNRKLTSDDIFKLFMIKNAEFNCSPSRLAECYERLMKVSEGLNDRKKKMLFSSKGYTRSKIYRDLLLDFNGLCYKNERFKFINAKTSKLFESRDNLCETTPTGQIIPLTEEQNRKFENIEKQYYDILRDYNEYVLDQKYGITQLYDSIRKLITEKLCVYGGIKHNTRSTSFENKFNIPKKYQKQNEFNPYYVFKDRKVDNIIFNGENPEAYLI